MIERDSKRERGKQRKKKKLKMTDSDAPAAAAHHSTAVPWTIAHDPVKSSCRRYMGSFELQHACKMLTLKTFVSRKSNLFVKRVGKETKRKDLLEHLMNDECEIQDFSKTAATYLAPCVNAAEVKPTRCCESMSLHFRFFLTFDDEYDYY
ncbi:uncharacterized protein V6R79_013393 [Siganus canaliculatus]